MKILSIGNSFSQDAQRYLHAIAKHNGVDIYSENLVIGGCSLETHYNNMREDNANYELEINGQPTGKHSSIKSALLSNDWDFVTLQQVSSLSGYYSTYNPYLTELFAYVKQLAPSAKILIHQTWAYEDKCDLLYNTAHFNSADEMFSAVQNSYENCLKDLPFDGLIPSGKAMITSVKLGIGKIHRDTFHASYGAGRYLLGLTWYKTLTGNDITNDTFNDFDEPVLDSQRKIVIEAVNSVLK